MYIIGNESFNNKTEMNSFVNDLFKKNGFGKANPSTHAFLMELIKRHPEYETKLGVGILHFTISQNPFTRVKCFHLSLTRTDKSIDGISFNTCIKGKKMTDNQQTLNAMRNSIHCDIKYFKMTAKQGCNLCGIVDVDFDCDHYGIEFKEISENFIKMNGVRKTFTKDECFMCFVDEEYKKKWIDYHNEKATLQLLCVSCHKNKKTKKKCLII